jgi:hypothetical protein
VLVFPSEAERWDRQSRRFQVATADRTAHFSVTGLPPGAYLAVALGRASGEPWVVPSFFDAVRLAATRVTLRAAERRAITLRPVAPGRGTVDN